LFLSPIRDAAGTRNSSAPAEVPGPASDHLAEELDARYSALIPQDHVISDRLEALLQQRPDDFAPAS
jgi:hypothetical protein